MSRGPSCGSYEAVGGKFLRGGSSDLLPDLETSSPGHFLSSHTMAASLLRLLVLAIALVSASGLRVFVGSARPAVMRSVSASMALPSIDDARALSTEELEAEMATAKKDLFELRKKVKTRQQVGGRHARFILCLLSLPHWNRPASAHEQNLFQLLASP